MIVTSAATSCADSETIKVSTTSLETWSAKDQGDCQTLRTPPAEAETRNVSYAQRAKLSA